MRRETWLVVLVAMVACRADQEGGTGYASAHVPEDRSVQLRDVRLHYLDWGGEGDLVLLVPGVTATAHVWDAVAPHLVDRYRVIAVTRRGHGASGAAGATFDLDVLADDLGQVIERFSDDAAIVVGHSYAGLEMPRLYQRHTEKVKALIFVDALFGRPWDGPGPPGPPGFGPPASSYGSASEAAAWLLELYPSIDPDLAERYVASQLIDAGAGRLSWRIPVPSATLTQFLSLKEDWSSSDYEAIRVPVMVIRAAQARYYAANLAARGYPPDSIEMAVRWAQEVDDAQKIRTVSALFQSIPDAVSVVLDSASHVLPLDRPELVVQLILDFLESRTEPTGGG